MTKRERNYHKWRNVKLIYCGTVVWPNNDTMQPVNSYIYLEDDQIDYCEHCSGTGEGRADGIPCNFCNNGVKRKKKEREPD